MIKFLILTVLFLVSEIFIAFIFAVIAQVFYEKIGFDFKSIFKGIMERTFLFISISSGYIEGLTFFSALKLATRLKHTDDGKSMEGFNDYYLLGNLVSVAVVFFYVYLFKHYDTIGIFNFIGGTKDV